MKFIVVMGASRPNKLMPMYLDQLEGAGIENHIVNLPQVSSPSDGTMGFCLSFYRDVSSKFSHYDRLIITDAWDVLFYGDRDAVEDRLNTIGPSPIFAAERNCYPEPQLSSIFAGDTPWKFVNGGMLTASPERLLEWCDAVESHPEYDLYMIGQQWLNRRRAEKSPLVGIDVDTWLFYCMFLEDQGNELKVVDGKPHNTLMGTDPLFYHFNGCWPHEPFLEMMKCTQS